MLTNNPKPFFAMNPIVNVKVGCVLSVFRNIRIMLGTRMMHWRNVSFLRRFRLRLKLLLNCIRILKGLRAIKGIMICWVVRRKKVFDVFRMLWEEWPKKRNALWLLWRNSTSVISMWGKDWIRSNLIVKELAWSTLLAKIWPRWPFYSQVKKDSKDWEQKWLPANKLPSNIKISSKQSRNMVPPWNNCKKVLVLLRPNSWETKLKEFWVNGEPTRRSKFVSMVQDITQTGRERT